MILRLHALVCDGAFEVDVKIMEEALAGVSVGRYAVEQVLLLL